MTDDQANNLLLELREVRALLNRLLVPVQVEEARQVLAMDATTLKQHNQAVLKSARAKQRRQL